MPSRGNDGVLAEEIPHSSRLREGGPRLAVGRYFPRDSGKHLNPEYLVNPVNPVGK